MSHTRPPHEKESVEEPGVGTLLARVIGRVVDLFQDGTDLITATVREEIARFEQRAAALAVASAAVAFGLLFLANGAALLLAVAVGRPAAYLIVGGAATAAGLLVLWSLARRVKRGKP
jgi:hypothetical protein